MSAIVSAENIIDFIPQRPPFVMVGDILSRKNNQATTSFYIQKNNVLVKENVFTVSGLLENIAQTAAANAGYDCFLKNIPVPLGFIGAISKVAVTKLPEADSQIETKIEVLQEVFGITLIKGEVTQNNQPIISCQMKIMIQNTTPKPWNL